MPPFALYSGIADPSSTPTLLSGTGVYSPASNLPCPASWYIYATLKQTAVLDVRQFIDTQPFSRYQLLVASLCGLIVFIDGFDAQVMGPVLPVLSAQLHVARPILGSMISSGTFGMMIGALI